MQNNNTEIVLRKQYIGMMQPQILQKMQRNPVSQSCPNLDQQIIKQGTKISQWPCQKLVLCGSPTENPFVQMKEIQFSRLKQIIFCKAQINTIEPLSQLKAPNIRALFISECNITSIKPLYKMQSKWINSVGLRMIRLTIDTNHINEADELALAKWKNLQGLWLNYLFNKNNQIMSIRFLSKLQHPKQNPKTVGIDSNKRIIERSVIGSLLRKQKNIKISTPTEIFTS